MAIDVSNLLPMQGFTVIGAEAGDRAGYSVSSAGDINGDTFEDFVIAAPFADTNFNDQTIVDGGIVYVVYGTASGIRPNLDLALFIGDPSLGFTISNVSSTINFGISVAAAGDVNGDTVPDIVIGFGDQEQTGSTENAAFVLFGKEGATRDDILIDPFTTSPSDGFFITRSDGTTSPVVEVAGAGDINNDGFNDILIATPFSVVGDPSVERVGAVHVVYGRDGGTRSTVQLELIPEIDGFTIFGDTGSDASIGQSAGGIGDINGDAIDDFIIGAPIAGTAGLANNTAFVIYGRTGPTTSYDIATFNQTLGFAINAPAGQELGVSVDGVGFGVADFNGDRIVDIAIGGPARDVGGDSKVYVVFGTGLATRPDVNLAALAPVDGFTINRGTLQDQLGLTVAGTGDFNNDGRFDLLIGAPQALENGSVGGQAYIVFGKSGALRPDINLATAGRADVFTITGDLVDDQFGFDVASAGDINNDNIDDIVIGAPFADDMFADDAGKAYVIYGSETLSATGPIVGDDGNNTLFGTPQADTIVGLGGNDVLVGLADNDTLEGGADNDVLVGGEGDDMLIGGTGLNQLIGGAGDDFYRVEVRTDSIVELTDEGTDLVETSVSAFTLAANVENLSFVGVGSFIGIGNAVANRIVGGTGADTVHGLGGDDVLDGGSGAANTLVGGLGDDTYIVKAAGDSVVEAANEGMDTVETVLASHTLRANVENLRFTGTGGFVGIGNALNNVITGNSGGDVLHGGEGDDTLFGAFGAPNVLVGGAGNDIYEVTAAGDSVVEAADEGTDEVRTNLQTFTLRQNVENLTYFATLPFTGIGNNEANRITGATGNDFLSGLGGNDMLIGGNGTDTLLGGAGADQFVFSAGEVGPDRILDFTTGEDRIALVQSTFNPTMAFAFAQGGAPVATTTNTTFLYNTVNGRLFIDIDGTGIAAPVHFATLNAGLSLTAGDFLFI